MDGKKFVCPNRVYASMLDEFSVLYFKGKRKKGGGRESVCMSWLIYLLKFMFSKRLLSKTHFIP